MVNGGPSGRVTFEKKAKYKRSLRLSSDQLKLLNLDYGSNDARFSITTKLQGTAWCSCHIYLMRWDDKLVISDIDGTITKSDVLGHVIPAIGGTWAHSGVAELYTRIKNNGLVVVDIASTLTCFKLPNGLFVIPCHWAVPLHKDLPAKHCPGLADSARWSRPPFAHFSFDGLPKVLFRH